MADDETSDGEEGIVNVSASLISNSQSAELVKPAQRSLDDPAMYTKATAVSRVPFGNSGVDADFSQSVAMGLGVVGAIGIQRIKPIAWRTDFPSDGRNVVDQFKQLRHVMFIGGGGVRDDGNAAAIGQNMVFTAGFSTIHGVWTRQFAPPTARTEALSTTLRLKSIRSSRRSRSRSTRWMVSQTPASCQSRNRRQQVMPQPQPISCGRSSQGMPVLRTKRMPAKQARSGMGLRPGWHFLCRRTRRFGSMIAHNSSETSIRAISCLL